MTELDRTNTMGKDGGDASRRIHLEQAQIICVIGGPGVGKGTQCARLVKDLGVSHLSVGDLLRAKAEEVLATQGIDIKACMREGKLVPKEIIQSVLEDELVSNVKAGNTRILLDGFPRSIEQAKLFEAGGSKIKGVLSFEADKDIMLSRVRSRAKTSGRVDDTEAIFEKRYQGFLEEREEIIHYFKQEKKLFQVDCNSPLGNIYAKVRSLVKGIFSGESSEGDGLVNDEREYQT